MLCEEAEKEGPLGLKDAQRNLSTWKMCSALELREFMTPKMLLFFYYMDKVFYGKLLIIILGLSFAFKTLRTD